MALVDLIMPKMGESIMEATILKWTKKVGEQVKMDETVLEIATDKVDSEVPSPFAGTLTELLFQEGDVVPVGTVIARLDNAANSSTSTPAASPAAELPSTPAIPENTQLILETPSAPVGSVSEGRFYSPLVLNIAKAENISMSELEKIPGTGQDSRVTKKDILIYIEQKQKGTNSIPEAPVVASKVEVATPQITVATPSTPNQVAATTPNTSIASSENVEIVEMDRMRKLIADHMVMSKKVSPHVTSFVECDVTNLVLWREKAKRVFESREGEKLTFTPLFIEAITKAIKDFPRINSSINGYSIYIKKDINIGMATALPNGNLIVPVIKYADKKNLAGLTKDVNELANKARKNALKPDDIEGGTFTLTNVGTFGNLMGTPIINQPQVAIMATGAIKKKPVVLETPQGDVIAIRHMMFLSLSYDHRVVDGAMGGGFLRKVADILEAFDINREI